MIRNTLVMSAAAAFANSASAAANRVEPQFTAATSAVPMPERKRAGGSQSIYPFDSLTAVGMSFGVMNKTAKSLSSVVSIANKKAMVDKTDENGQVVYKTKEVTDANGNKINVPTNEPERVATKHFFAADVDPKKDPDKASARIFRDQ